MNAITSDRITIKTNQTISTDIAITLQEAAIIFNQAMVLLLKDISIYQPHPYYVYTKYGNQLGRVLIRELTRYGYIDTSNDGAYYITLEGEEHLERARRK